MELKQVIEWLISNGFVQSHKGKFKFCAKVYKHLTGVEKGLTPQGTVLEPSLLAVVEEYPSLEKAQLYNYQDWVQFYQHFIALCRVPAKIEMSNGNTYSGNKYSEDGMKAFQKAIKEGFRYDVLRTAVTLYYASATRWKKAIGNYMIAGEWRTDYHELLEQAANGSLQKHIKKIINEATGAGSHFDLG